MIYVLSIGERTTSRTVRMTRTEEEEEREKARRARARVDVLVPSHKSLSDRISILNSHLSSVNGKW